MIFRVSFIVMFFLERQRYWTTTALNTSILFDTAHRVHNFILKKDEYTTIIGLQIILFMFIDKHENRKTTIKKFFLLSVKELFIAFAYHVKVTGFQASRWEYFNFFSYHAPRRISSRFDFMQVKSANVLVQWFVISL